MANEFAGCADLSWQLDRDARLFLIERAEDAPELVVPSDRHGDEETSDGELDGEPEEVLVPHRGRRSRRAKSVE